jgi:hypothetical protein
VHKYYASKSRHNGKSSAEVIVIYFKNTTHIIQQTDRKTSKKLGMLAVRLTKGILFFKKETNPILVTFLSSMKLMHKTTFLNAGSSSTKSHPPFLQIQYNMSPVLHNVKFLFKNFLDSSRLQTMI